MIHLVVVVIRVGVARVRVAGMVEVVVILPVVDTIGAILVGAGVCCKSMLCPCILFVTSTLHLVYMS